MRRPIVNYRCAVQPGDGPVPYACPPTAQTVHCCRATELGNTPRMETSQGAPGGSGLADPSSDDDLFSASQFSTHEKDRRPSWGRPYPSRAGRLATVPFEGFFLTSLSCSTRLSATCEC